MNNDATNAAINILFGLSVVSGFSLALCVHLLVRRIERLERRSPSLPPEGEK